jgi:gamma-F420-2:alpha-L-glutamate ligase
MNPKGWLIYNEKDAIENKTYIEWFIKEARKQELTLELIIREQLTIGITQNQHSILYNQSSTELPRFAIVRTVEPLLNLQLEYLGVSVFNSAKISDICNHKGKTYFEIAKLDIPMPKTLFLKSENLNQTPPLNYPFVIKEVAGRGGKQVHIIQNNKQWDNFLAHKTNTEYVIQDTNVQLGKDLRVFVVGKEIIGAVLRESKTDFRANYKLGGDASWYALASNEETLITKIIQQFDFGMVGIDFLIGHHGELIFNEIEDIVGSRTLSAVSDINILEKYVSLIKSKVTR